MENRNFLVHKNEVAFHPGYYLDEIIKNSIYTYSEFAEKLNISLGTLLEIICGKKDIDKDMAEKISNVLGMSVSTWMNIQHKYDSLLLKWGIDEV